MQIPLNRRRVAGLLLAAQAACAPGDGGDGLRVTRSDSAGVTIVENLSGEVSLGSAVRMLTVLAPPDSALMPLPWAVAADRMAGRIYIADGMSARVAVFDADGTWVWDLGRRGDGPGEFRSPAAAVLDPGGTLAVWDTGREIVSRWSREGDLLDETRAPLDYWGPGMAVGNGWTAAVVARTSPDGMEIDQQLMRRAGQDSVVVHHLKQELAVLRLPCLPDRGFPAPRILAPSVAWDAQGETLVYREGGGYRIDSWVGGAVVRSVRRLLGPIPVTDEMAARGALEGPGPYRGLIRRCQSTPEKIAAAVGHEDAVSPVMAVALAPGGGLWVTRTLDGIGPGAVDVFGPDGSYQGTFPFHGWVADFLSDSVFVAVDLDVDGSGAPRAALYRLDDGH